MTAAAPLLAVENLAVHFEGFEGRAQALAGIDLSVEPGETVGVVGETGCGKSVLARSLLRLDRRARMSGGIRFAGDDVLAMDAAALRRLRGGGIGLVFQDPGTALNPLFTIGRQLRGALRAHGHAADAAAAASLLDRVRLPDAASLLARYPHELSGGMRQRVLIALALAGGPRLLVADEPTTALDVAVQKDVLALLAALVAQEALTLLLISHDLGVIGAACRRVVVMYAGTIVEDAPAASLFDAPLHPYTAGLLAAVPRIDGASLPRPIAGGMPDPRRPPPGCRFAARCPIAMPVCGVTPPALRTRGEAHRVACHAA